MPRDAKKNLVKKEHRQKRTAAETETPTASRASVIALLRTLDETLDAKLDLAQDHPTQQVVLYHNVERPPRTPPCKSDDPRYRFMLYVSASRPPKR
jgi:hypothetical protein